MIIAISGKMRRGKDTIANHIIEKYGFVKRPFADKLKQICMTYDNSTSFSEHLSILKIAEDLFQSTTPEVLEKIYNVMRTAQADLTWKGVGSSGEDCEIDCFEDGDWIQLTKEECYGEKTPFSRVVLQRVGNQMKNITDPTIWVKYVLKDHQICNIIIPDLRYQDEAELLKNYQDVCLIRVERTAKHIKENGGTISSSEHISELDLDDYPDFNIRLKNNGNIKDLYKTIDTNVGPAIEKNKK